MSRLVDCTPQEEALYSLLASKSLCKEYATTQPLALTALHDAIEKRFKRARRRIEKSEKEHKLSLTSEIKQDLSLNDTDSDSDESVSGSGSESSGSERPSRKRKRPLEDGEEESDAGERGNASENQEEEDSESDVGGGDDQTSAERGPTVGDALNNPLFYVSEDQQACVVCPSKLFKNQHMAELHTGATHHIRRYSRFKEAVERLSTRFDDIDSDFASNVVRVMDSAQQSKPGATSHEQPGMSKRALKKQNLARKRERQHKKKKSNGEAKEVQPPQEKEAIPGPKKPLKRRKLEAVEASHTEPNPKPSLPSDAPRLPRSTKSANGQRPKAVKA